MKLPKIKLPVRKVAGKVAPIAIGLIAVWAQAKIGRVADRAVERVKRR